MQYTQLGKTGIEVSRLGFGCMRLPMRSDTQIDRDLAIPLLHRAVELGITYFDTAVGYCAGDSQRVVGEAMESMRDKVIISTKNHHYDKADKDGWWKHLNDSLERLRTDHIDIYNFHGLNYERFESALDGDDGLYRDVLKAKEQGMIRHICHSFHGSLDSLKKCIETGLFESVTVQYNLLDQSLEEAMSLAANNDMGVVVMGPVGGGRLGYPTGKASEIAGEVKSTPELALRFVLSNEHVNVALSGMSDLQQLEENVETLSNLGELTPSDHHRIEAAVEERKKLAGLYCTGCNYCLPCPDNVDIPGNFEILNLDRVFGLTDHAKSRYAAIAGKAALCRQCGKCVELCPQELDIPTRLGESVAMLDERSGSVAGWGELSGASMGDDGTLSVGLRYHIKNFTENGYKDVGVALRSHREEQVVPADIRFDNFKGFTRRHKDLSIRTLAPLESMSVDSVITFDGSHTVEHLSYNVVGAFRRAVRRASLRESPSLGPATGKTDSSNGVSDLISRPTNAVVHAPAPTHPSAHTLKNHSFDFALVYDENYLYFWAEVEDDLQCLASATPGNATQTDYLRIYLDGRPKDKLVLGGYGDGVFHITIAPSSDSSIGHHTSVSSQIEIDSVFERGAFGYTVGCAIPWSSFADSGASDTSVSHDVSHDVSRDVSHDVLGMDVVLVSHDDAGKEVVRLSWTGREGQDRDTSTFGRLLIIR